ncbi:MAG: hypothetical protein AAF744_00985 [Pseudomonadota bacterium]
MRIFDCFPLFNEIDLLELRLNELWDVVDFFVIVEAKATFTGNPKPLCLRANEDRLAKYMHKFRYVVVEAFPDGMSNWGKEEYQRNALRRELRDLAPDDVVLFSDLDEIPRASVVAGIAKGGIARGEVYCLSLDWYSFYLNIKVAEKWERQGPRMIRGADLGEMYPLRYVLAPRRGWAKNAMRQLKSSWRMGRWLNRILVPDAGWHFTWMGGREAVALKGSSIPNHSSMPEGEKTPQWADARIAALMEDPARYTRVPIDEHFPAFVRDNPTLFAPYILKD